MATTKSVKNVSDAELSIPGIGIVAPRAVVEVPLDFHNANFEEVKQAPRKKDEKESETA